MKYRGIEIITKVKYTTDEYPDVEFDTIEELKEYLDIRARTYPTEELRDYLDKELEPKYAPKCEDCGAIITL